ncbi:ZinT family metal-binding protein [Falsirhodobacter sp. 20TX0035]|uniref:ZinT family metal-binding protein n=1 Tax=Falsirhodobacter sp. 20TX0035 TaxID=3022019 RepID=UPI00232E7D2D|nr:metal-binding protein ZinT [Falsirhodobacter sp. 20TX0035]MDB6454237.1 metal-binding protein ZinT [Falsirhodobacter sp. 20TX0035]
METKFAARVGALAMTGLLLVGTGLVHAHAAHEGEEAAHDHGHEHHHDHDHAHGHSHSHAQDPVSQNIQRGLFLDGQIQSRPLSNWEGDWQSVYPLLLDGTLDGVMAHKAETGSKTIEDYKSEYETGYRTNVDRIVIDGNDVAFHEGDKVSQGTYEDDGHETLVYKAGNRGVRYIFRKVSGDDAAPDFIQFSDHGIRDERSGHFHLFWGDDRAALLEEVTNWPTYYPSAMSDEEVAEEMLAH